MNPTQTNKHPKIIQYVAYTPFMHLLYPKGIKNITLNVVGMTNGNDDLQKTLELETDNAERTTKAMVNNPRNCICVWRRRNGEGAVVKLVVYV